MAKRTAQSTVARQERSRSGSLDVPARDYFLPYQRRWITDESALKFYPKSRRIGITFGTGYRATTKCMRKPAFTQWVTSRDMLTAKEFVTDYIAKFSKAANVVARGLDGENVRVVDELHGITAFLVEFENNSRVVSLSSTPEAFAGKGGDVLIDEGALHKDFGKVLDMALPCITWGNQLEVVSALPVDSSPDDVFVQMMRDIETGGNPQGWSYHKTSILDAVAEGFVEKLNEVTGSTHTREQWLADMRARCRNEAAWQSQYLIVPQDAGGCLLPYELIGGCEVADPAAQPGEGPLYIGMDIGRKHDLSVIWTLEKLGDTYWTRDVRVLEKTPFRHQLDILCGIMDQPRVVRCCIDATGIGAMLTEEAQRRHGQYRVEAVNFTQASKEEMAMTMLARFEDRQVRIPQQREIREDLHKIRKTVTAAGNIRYEADRDDAGHADRFWSLALALHAGSTSGEPAWAAAIAGSAAGAAASRDAVWRRPDHSNDFTRTEDFAY